MTAELVWGIRGSLLRYVDSSGGSVSLAPPAAWSDGLFRFPSRPGEPGDALKFVGEVLIRAHGGLLDVQIADPALELVDGIGILSVAVLDRSRRYRLASVVREDTDLDGPVVFAAVLHEEAASLFGGVYEVGTALDPIMLDPGVRQEL